MAIPARFRLSGHALFARPFSRAASARPPYTILGEPDPQPSQSRKREPAQRDGGARVARVEDSLSSPWRMGDPPETLQKHVGVTFLTDPRDARVALYCQKRHQDRAECAKQEIALARRALGKGSTVERAPPKSSQEEERRDCMVELHYSWECLQRLREAQVDRRSVLVHSVLVPSMPPDELLELATAVAPVYAVEPQLFAAYFQSKVAGVAALACSFVVAFPVSKPLASLRPPVVILDGLQNPRNIGQILRTAVHLGVTSVVASRSAWDCLTGRAARSSMGWFYHVDYHLADPLEGALRELRDLGVRIYAAENHFHAPVQPHAPAGDKRWALILGSEDSGISGKSRRLSDARVSVPQRGGASLNVAHAAAICLYELGRHMDPQPDVAS